MKIRFVNWKNQKFDYYFVVNFFFLFEKNSVMPNSRKIVINVKTNLKKKINQMNAIDVSLFFTIIAIAKP